MWYLPDLPVSPQAPVQMLSVSKSSPYKIKFKDADSHFPCKLWDAGEKCLTLSNFEWNATTRTLLYGQMDIPYNVPLPKPDIQEENPIRVYSRKEIEQILVKNGMSVLESFADFDGTPSSENGMQLMVLSQKNISDRRKTQC